MRASRGAAAAAATALVALLALSPIASAHRHPQLLFRIQPGEIDESSSLVVSQTHSGLVYTANDSGGSATVYVLDATTGDLVGSTSLEGVEPVDIEAMATGPDGTLLVADIGDNPSTRPYVTVYRIQQPGRGTHTVTADAVRLTYSTGSLNAEAAVYDGDTGRLFVMSKEYSDGRIYRSPRHLFGHRQVVMRPVATGPVLATDAALLPGGDVAAIRSYFAAYFYALPGWRRIAERELPAQPQGESLATPPDGSEIWIGSEGVHSRVLAVRVPNLAPPTPPTTAPPPAPTSGSPTDRSPAAPNEHNEQLKSRALLIGGGALASFVVVVLVVAIRWHRHPHVD